MNKYLLEYEYEESFNAGSKARDDIRFFLDQFGFTLLLLKYQKNKIKKVLHLIKLPYYLKTIKTESIVFIQLPLTYNKWYINFILRILKMKKCFLIGLIHDILSLRQQLGKSQIKNEINIFNKFSIIISHNNFMTSWLKENNIQNTVINLKLFDYYSENFFINKTINENENIIFAGNLDKRKSGFIYKLTNNMLGDLRIKLYGSLNSSEIISNNKIEYMGKVKPSELPKLIKDGRYGLIWDGNELDCCDGIYGEYAKYNNPHKLSLYIASGLPVIVWEKSAIAKFVKENNIGLIVNSLIELEKAVKDINDEKYNLIRKNVLEIRDKILQGNFICDCVRYSLEFRDKIKI